MRYRIPVTALDAKLRKDSGLDFQIICKLCHELREAQCHAFLLSRRHAVGRLGLFLQMLENSQIVRGEGAGEIYLPMSRSDIGNYIGISGSGEPVIPGSLQSRRDRVPESPARQNYRPCRIEQHSFGERNAQAASTSAS